MRLHPPRRVRLALLVLAALVVATVPGRVAAQDPPVEPPPGETTTTTAPPVTEPPPGPDEPPPLPTLPPGGLRDPVDPGDPDEPPVDPGPPPPDPSPQIRVLMARLTVLDAERALDGANGALAEATTATDEQRARLAEAEDEVVRAEARVDASQDVLADMAVASFMYAGGASPRAGQELSIFQQRQDQQLAGAVLEHRVGLVTDAKQRLADARVERDRLAEEVEAADAVRAEREQVVVFGQRLVDDARHELSQAARDQDLVVPFDRNDPYHWQLTIMGPSVLTLEEITGWALRYGNRSRAQAPIEELAAFFVEEGDTEGIRGDMAFAQAVLETGMFTNDDTVRFNNYSGIGHCDSCPSGWPFPSPREGVRAQMQLLKSYVFEKPTYEHPLVDRRLRGPAGCCQTWNQLTGVWASAPGYGPIIQNAYRSMLEYALAVRTGAPPPRV